MINEDTIKLLRECDSGIKMGLKAIEEVIDEVHSEELKKCLQKCRENHERLKNEINILLDEYKDKGKEPNFLLKSMSWLKTNMEMEINDSDENIADILTDGCNMGIKSLNHFLNKYKEADEKSKDITKKLINEEQQLLLGMRDFL